jgi:hypothetical protein
MPVPGAGVGKLAWADTRETDVAAGGGVNFGGQSALARLVSSR